ncbi:MAG: helix-turn-helix transcriptional regulator [Lachnospiraceae bacterium]|nr:helix-turn-helix transcriptional regulator [Lachnospiraceae bacterium]
MENRDYEWENYLRGRKLGDVVLTRRKELNWTQDELEYQSGVSVRQISRIEGNQSKPSLETIEKLEKALGIPLMGTLKTHRQQPGAGKDAKKQHDRLLRKLKEEATRHGLSDAEITEMLEKAIAQMEAEKK